MCVFLHRCKLSVSGIQVVVNTLALVTDDAAAREVLALADAV
jgi:hypothetical protein